ncbi:MAG: ester cyclase [Anaerolineae bacterium]|nr:ester cyclase [Anaerolineae bacterium]MDK1117477.1 ester cyclase [Anaerolineae bacterium]
MSREQNLDLIHRLYEALNAKDLDAHYELWTEDMIWHGPPGFGDIHRIDGFINKVMKPFYESFPDYHVSNDIEVADENWASATGYLTGTHQGEWLGIPATGKPVKMLFSDFWLIKDGKISENWVMVDHVEVLRQIGIDAFAQAKA